jgi:hypothetical protein
MKLFRSAFIPPINGVGFLRSLRVISENYCSASCEKCSEVSIVDLDT